jgi:hypothetical protein
MPLLRNTLWLLTGMLLATVLWVTLAPIRITTPHVNTPEHRTLKPSRIDVTPTDAHGIQKALALAMPGDVVYVPPGDYLGPVRLKSGVQLVSTVPGRAVLRSDPAGPSDVGMALVAQDVKNARVSGFRILADETHPLRRGIWLTSSDVSLDNLDVSGAIEAGIRMEGNSLPVVTASFVHANSGPGLIIGEHASALVVSNWITDNGHVADALQPGIQLDEEAHPQLERHVIARNGGGPVAGASEELYRQIDGANLLIAGVRHRGALSRVR